MKMTLHLKERKLICNIVNSEEPLGGSRSAENNKVIIEGLDLLKIKLFMVI